MDYRGVSKRTYKNLKKEIVEDTALNVGYYPGVLGEINNYLLMDVVKEISLNGWITENTSDVDLQNMIVTESVKKMSYQEFKDVAEYFFSFVPDDKEQYYRTSSIEVTRENYDYLVNNTNKAFGLERELENIQKEQNSLDTKISSLETEIVPNDDIVVGVDLENEELLLLKSDRNAYIDEDVVLDDNLLNNYKSRNNDYTQILDKLAETFEEINFLKYEYTLNNDTYRGMLDIDPTDIYEIDDLDISSFRTHEKYYNYAKQFNSFSEQYPTYKDYIKNRYEFIYQYSYAPDYSKEILEEKRNEIDKILEEKESYLVIKDIYGYSQGEHWTLGYLAENTETMENVEKYLENYVGAWYRGSLTELRVIPFEAFEKGKYTGDIEAEYYIDTALLYNYDDKGNLNKIKEIYPELSSFKTKEEALKQLEVKEQKKEYQKEQEKGRTI